MKVGHGNNNFTKASKKIAYFQTRFMGETGVRIEVVFGDPSFWQALGKAFGWNGVRVEDDGSFTPEWKICWHHFMDYLADGKTAEEFFKGLN